MGGEGPGVGEGGTIHGFFGGDEGGGMLRGEKDEGGGGGKGERTCECTGGLGKGGGANRLGFEQVNPRWVRVV